MKCAKGREAGSDRQQQRTLKEVGQEAPVGNDVFNYLFDI